MSGFEIYAWYLAPLVALAFCYGVYVLASRGQDQTPAE
jgi:hypothetical protein